jgi:hypothetical protein
VIGVWAAPHMPEDVNKKITLVWGTLLIVVGQEIYPAAAAKVQLLAAVDAAAAQSAVRV